MLSAFRNVTKIPELRQRILFTLAIIFIVRLGANLPLPGISIDAVNNFIDHTRSQGGQGGAAAIGAMLAMFTGGATQQGAVFALGIMPYISASIIMQMLNVLVPTLSKISKEDGGRERLNQYTRYLAIALAAGQGYMLVNSLQHPETNPLLGGFDEATMGALVPNPGFMSFVLPGLIAIVAGTMLLMWLGEMVTERGIGNGVSLIITVNIAASLPGALVMLWNALLGEATSALSGVTLVVLVSLLLLVIAGVIALTQGQRRIPVQYPKQARGGRKAPIGASNQTSYLPLKVNYSGVMPIIFAQALMLLPISVLPMIGGNSEWVFDAQRLLGVSHWLHYVVLAIMIFLFSYFWVSIFFQPQQMADDLKRGGGYIPGVRPGNATALFLDKTMTRLTFAGSLFLTSIAVMPALIQNVSSRAFNQEVPYLALQLFGGTSILIMVGVILDIMRQLETHLIQHNYEGFLRKGRVRGARYGRVGTSKQVVRKDKAGAMLWMYLFMAAMSLVGTVLLLIERS